MGRAEGPADYLEIFMKPEIKIQDTVCEKTIDYPAEITFKCIFRTSSETLGSIHSVLNEHGIDAEISETESGKGKFISYTITAEYSDRDMLDNVCSGITTIENYMTMF